ncbi:MAG: hypothetical protein Q4F72_11430 [Desulfovibrionaceae bacterium]|nr:hypothetical protein [Desulfovibrionaceae bacterium]
MHTQDKPDSRTRSVRERPESIIAPGQMVREIMEKTYVGHAQAARRLGLTTEELLSFFEGELALSKELAFRLKEATGFTASYWQGFERMYRRRLSKWMAEERQK